ncbi:MAG: Cof-type HAD-IIB family hydrolase [Anaerolineae bacterium]
MTQTTTKKDIKLIVVDIDGTLLNSRKELSERTEKALKAALAMGVQIAFATGKTHNSAKALFDKIAFKAPGIFTQGLTLYDAEGKVTQQHTLPSDVCRQAITFAEDRGFVMLAYSGGRILAKAHNQQLFDEMAQYHELLEAVGPLQNVLNTAPINKLVAVGLDARSIKALRWQLNSVLGGSVRLVQAGINTMLEILPPGVSKGSALKLLTKDLRIPADSVMAIGDAENDIEMIQFAGWGVAMGQAEQNVKDAADFVAPSNDDDGVAVAIETFVLPDPVPPAVPVKAEAPVDAAAAPATAEKAADPAATENPAATSTSASSEEKSS